MDLSQRDYLEPDKQGLIIAVSTQDADNWWDQSDGRLYLWMVGKPRKIYHQKEPLDSPFIHNDNLLIKTRDQEGRWGLRFFIQNLDSGEKIISPKEVSKICSFNGDLCGVKTIYYPERYGKNPRPVNYDAIFYKIRSNNLLEEVLVKKNFEVRGLNSDGNNLIAEGLAHPTWEGTSQIINVSKDSIVHQESLHRDFAYGLVNFNGFSISDDKIYFSRFPNDISNQYRPIVTFPSLKWAHEEELRIGREMREIEEKEHDLDPFNWNGKKYLSLDEEFKSLEFKAKNLFGYSDFEKFWKEEFDYKNFVDQRILSGRRINFTNYLRDTFDIKHSVVFKNHFIYASDYNLFSFPVLDHTYMTNPFKHKIWTFRDKIRGLVVVEQEQLKKFKGNANLKMGNKKTQHMGLRLVA